MLTYLLDKKYNFLPLSSSLFIVILANKKVGNGTTSKEVLVGVSAMNGEKSMRVKVANSYGSLRNFGISEPWVKSPSTIHSFQTSLKNSHTPLIPIHGENISSEGG